MSEGPPEPIWTGSLGGYLGMMREGWEPDPTDGRDRGGIVTWCGTVLTVEDEEGRLRARLVHWRPWP